jgi:hypothetical protein
VLQLDTSLYIFFALLFLFGLGEANNYYGCVGVELAVVLVVAAASWWFGLLGGFGCEMCGLTLLLFLPSWLRGTFKLRNKSTLRL